jgi:hypothetical protein
MVEATAGDSVSPTVHSHGVSLGEAFAISRAPSHVLVPVTMMQVGVMWVLVHEP